MGRTISCKPPTGKMLLAYTSRGLEPPTTVGYSRKPWGLGRAMLHDTDDRRFHATYAFRHGFFWIPCKHCRRYFGGHEVSASRPDPTRGPGAGYSICTYCTVRGRTA